MKKIPLIIIRAYLRRWPIHLRKSQFNALNRYSWLKGPLEEIRNEFLPQDEKETDEVVAETGVVYEVAQSIQDSQILEVLKSEGIAGQRSTYHAEHWLGKRGNGDLLEGTDEVSRQPVVIKYYQLSQIRLNQVEFLDRQQHLQNLVRLSHPDNQPQEDLRVSWPIDAIADSQADDRYFLVMDQRHHGPTLKQWLAEQSLPLNPAKIRNIIGQILQSLMHLHCQPIRLTSDQLQVGLVHGNLNLENILCVERSGDEFFYLSDLALWENPFQDFHNSHKTTTFTGIPTQATIQKDLVDLGQIGAYVLDGSNQARENRGSFESDDDLAKFLEQLRDGQFQDAEVAWQVWLRLSPLGALGSAVLSQPEADLAKKRQSKRWWLFAGGTLLALLAIAGGWWWLLRARPSEVASLPCCFDQIESVPEGDFTYAIVKGGSWERVLNQQDLLSVGLSVEKAIKSTHQPFRLHNEPELAATIEEAINLVNEGDVDFAIIPLVDTINLPPELGYEIIAYDGLAAFVPFSYEHRLRGIPDELNGKISLEAIRHYFTHQSNHLITDKPRVQLELYMTTGEENSNEATQIFEKELLLEQSTFEEQLEKSSNKHSTESYLTTETMLQAMLEDFEEDTSILRVGFAPISEIMKQCSIYPLAISNNDKDGAVQFLVMRGGIAISPQTNLCDDKVLYQANVDVFRQDEYPLAYPIAVVFPIDNSHPSAGQKFAEMMRTAEAQRLLLESHLVPIVNPFDLAMVDVRQLAQGVAQVKSEADDEDEVDDGTSLPDSSYSIVRASETVTVIPDEPETSDNYILTPVVPDLYLEKLEATRKALSSMDATETHSEGDITTEDGMVREDNAPDLDAAPLP
ncbi:MAG: hypothetical protein AAFY20_20505 [Cyanobacteria bacterium J06639_14]